MNNSSDILTIKQDSSFLFIHNKPNTIRTQSVMHTEHDIKVSAYLKNNNNSNTECLRLVNSWLESGHRNFKHTNPWTHTAWEPGSCPRSETGLINLRYRARSNSHVSAPQSCEGFRAEPHYIIVTRGDEVSRSGSVQSTMFLYGTPPWCSLINHSAR